MTPTLPVHIKFCPNICAILIRALVVVFCVSSSIFCMALLVIVAWDLLVAGVSNLINRTQI